MSHFQNDMRARARGVGRAAQGMLLFALCTWGGASLAWAQPTATPTPAAPAQQAAPAQPQRELKQRLIISDARKNGRDITPAMVEKGAELIFYRRAGEDKLYLALIEAKNSIQTDGVIYALTTSNTPESADSYASETTQFRWSYTQADGVAGTAQVSLVRVKKPQGVIYQMTVLNESLDQWQYKGHVDGTMNLSVLQEKRD
jgi:hypothetical protein